MYSKNLQDGVGTSPGATNSWKKKKKIFFLIFWSHCDIAESILAQQKKVDIFAKI